jgi:hypothetical protein
MPEITRTFPYRKNGGACSNQIGGKFNKIMLNTDPLDWKTRHYLSYLEEGTFAKSCTSLVAYVKLVHLKQGLEVRFEQSGM